MLLEYTQKLNKHVLTQAPNIPTITQHTTYMETYHRVPSNAHKASHCLYIHNPTFLNNYNEITPVIFQNTNS